MRPGVLLQMLVVLGPMTGLICRQVKFFFINHNSLVIDLLPYLAIQFLIQMSMSQLMVHFDKIWSKMDLQGRYTLLKRTLTKAPTVFDQQACISFRRTSILPQDLTMTTGMIQETWIIQSISTTLGSLL
jgi:hypothetical protein